MESLNLNTLANSLPTAQQNAEKELLNDFKAAALSITTLYRSSRKNAKRAYNSGYAVACQDLLNFIQQGVSASDVGDSPLGSHAVDGGGMTIGKVMDWTEARLEAIKAREEEEDEDEEKDKERAAPPRPTIAHRAVTSPVVHKAEGKSVPLSSSLSANRLKDPVSSLPTPHSPVSHTANQMPSEPSSPSPPPSGPSSRSGQRPIKSRPGLTKEASQPVMPPSHPHTSVFLSEPSPSSSSTSSFPETPIVIGAGAKRRHAVMMMLDNPPISIGGPSSTVSSPGGVGYNNNTTYAGTTGSSLGRRRTRSTRNLGQLQPHNSNINVLQMDPEGMDVEEDGRERKRVARR
ncbi:hypothetical protein GALMADRAFT_245156 [Galerina marginata CBS 339.88]|uniref:Uncharacterized protein n=1 Tax=Galerina marginata (strain CBS 339.88) TaxID=685588 RepID=A0A067TDZ9_GALM3|nr:hypothetical protein GALMADRAFT_245156 [Galerina marginata CBS 339.88]